MGLIDSIKRVFGRQKENKLTPELLGHTLLVLVSSLVKNITEEAEKYKLQLDDSRQHKILQELFPFSYSVFLLVIGSKYPKIYESVREEVDYASLFLAEVRRAFIETVLPDQSKTWASSEDYFYDTFDKGYSFYFHDKIPEHDVKGLESTIRMMNCKDREDPYYWSVKLQYRLSQILPMTDFQFFTTLGFCNATALNEFIKRILLKIQPVNQ